MSMVQNTAWREFKRDLDAMVAKQGMQRVLAHLSLLAVQHAYYHEYEVGDNTTGKRWNGIAHELDTMAHLVSALLENEK